MKSVWKNETGIESWIIDKVSNPHVYYMLQLCLFDSGGVKLEGGEGDDCLVSKTNCHLEVMQSNAEIRLKRYNWQRILNQSQV